MIEFSARVIVRTIPETIAYLRSERASKRQPPRSNEGNMVRRPGSRPPLNLDAVDAADEQLMFLAYWAEASGVSVRNIGNVWRYPTGEVRGVLYDDSRPADVLAARLLSAMADPSWIEPAGMTDTLNQMMALQEKTFPAIQDYLWAVEKHEANTPDLRGIRDAGYVRAPLVA